MPIPRDIMLGSTSMAAVTERRRGEPLLGPRCPEEELLARAMVVIRAVTTGHVIREHVPPHELTTEELIQFWADDSMAPGRQGGGR
jgi:hypothetical protein